MSTNPGDQKTQLTDMVKAVGAILGVPLALFAVVNSIIAQPITSLVVALIVAVLVSVWIILSRWISITEIITAWLALAVVVLASFVIWPRTMTVEGFVYDTAHNPVSSEKVRLFDYSGKIYETKTDAEGYYQFVDVPSGKYRVQVRTSEVEGATKGILVRVVQQNLTVSEITPTASPTSVAAVPPNTPTVTLTPTNTSTPEPPTSTLTPTPASINATVTAVALNLRTGPGKGYARIGQLQQGDVVIVIGQNPGGDWLKVKHKGQTGWVAKECVEVPEEVAMVAIVEVPPTPTSTPSPEPTATPIPPQTPSPTTPPPAPSPTEIPPPTTPPPAPSPTEIPPPTTPPPAPSPTETPMPTPIPPPFIAITAPEETLACDNPEEWCVFEVRGAAGGVSSFIDLRIYTFVRPVNPPGAGWYFQEMCADILDADGSWKQSPSVLGHPGYPAENGDTLRIRAALVQENATFNGTRLSDLPGATVLQAVEDIEGIVVLSDVIELTVER